MNETSYKLATNRPYYEAVWRRVLEGWLRWPKERVDRFILNYDDDLNDQNSIFYHDVALYYVIPRLIPSHLGLEIGAYCSLYSSIDQAIGPTLEVERNPQFDWEAAKSRVEAVLASHDAALPGPEEIPDFLRKWLGEESQKSSEANI
jgi:hypothetical protein